MEDILPYLAVERKFSEDEAAGREIVVEDLTGFTLQQAQKQLKSQGLTAQFIGTGETVTSQIPEAGNTVPGNSQMLVYMGDEPEVRMVTLPDFTGMTRQQASDAAGMLGVYILVSGNDALDAVVTSQSAPKDSQVPVGTTIRLTFADIKAAD